MDYQLLAQVPIFENLPRSELQRLATEMNVVDLPAETVLFRKGDPGDWFCIVLEGQVEVFQEMGSEDERIIAVRGEGEFIGELSLLNPDGLRTAGVRATRPVRLWKLTHHHLDALIKRQPYLAYEIARVLSERLTTAQTKTIQDLQEKNLQLTKAYQELKAAQAQIIEKEKLERELEVARDIQMSILPQGLPRLTGYEFGATIVPARAVGGDFYDLIPLDADRVAVVVGDVTGKGVPAAIFMAQIHSLLHVAADLCSTPQEVLQRVNHQLVTMGRLSLFATVLYGVLDVSSGQFAYARAGHEPPILSLAGGEAYRLPWSDGQPLGFLEEPETDIQAVTIPQGATLLLYSDGITDGRNPEGEFFGRDRLLQHMSNLAGTPAQAVCDQLWQSLEAHRGESDQYDDATLVAIQALGELAP